MVKPRLPERRECDTEGREGSVHIEEIHGSVIELFFFSFFFTISRECDM